MPNDYTKLSGKFSEKLESIRETLGNIEKVPSSIKERLRTAESHRAEADKKHSQGHIDEASKEMKQAVDCAEQVELGLSLVPRFQEVCAASEFFKEHKDLAAQHIPNYIAHNGSFLVAKELLESDKPLGGLQVSFLVGDLYVFLVDIKRSKDVLVAAIKEKEENKKESKKRFWINIIAIVAAAIFGTAIGSLLTYLLCKPAQTESNVSGAEQQSATNNSALTT